MNISGTLLLAHWAYSRLSDPDTPTRPTQPASVKQNIRIQDPGQIDELKLQTDLQPGQPELPLFSRKMARVTLYLNQPNYFQEELTTVKDVSTNHLAAYIEKMLAEETLTAALETWADARKQDCVSEPCATVNDNRLRLAKTEALEKLNKALSQVHNAWPGEAQPDTPGQTAQRRQSLADHPCFGLFQELNVAYFRTPSLNTPGTLATMANWAHYALTGQYPKSCQTPPQRPLLVAMDQLCKQYPGITLGQLMDTLDSQPWTAHSEAVQALLRFRDTPWKEAEATDRPAQPDKHAREATEVAVNPLQTKKLPGHSQDNRWQPSGEDAEPAVAANTTGNEKAVLNSLKKETLPLANAEKTTGRYLAANSNTPVYSSVLANRGTKHNTHPNNHPGGDKSHGIAAIMLTGLSFAGLFGSTGAVTIRDFATKLVRGAGDEFLSLKYVCPPDAYHRKTIHKRGEVVPFGRVGSSSVLSDGTVKHPSDFCEHFCITNEFDSNENYKDSSWTILKDRCKIAFDHMESYFNVFRARLRYSCEVTRKSYISDDTQTRYFYYLDKYSHDCIDDYATEECRYLSNRFIDPAGKDLCKLCDAAKESKYHCTPLPRANTFNRFLTQDQLIIYQNSGQRDLTYNLLSTSFFCKRNN